MKKDNKLVKFTIFVLLITIVAICLVSGTFAKYTSKVSGKDTAIVAKWDIELNDNKIMETDTVSFDLFKSVNDTNVKKETEEGKPSIIAPGTTGSFVLKVENLSQVTAKYSIAFETTETTIPLKFAVGTVDENTVWKDSIEDLNVTDDVIAIDAEAETVTVNWKWDFEGGRDEADTNLGITPETVTVTATLTATQVD